MTDNDDATDPRVAMNAIGESLVAIDDATDPRVAMNAIGESLVAIDSAIRDKLGHVGGPGAGLHYILNQLAVATLGVPHTPLPSETKPEDGG